MSDHEDEAMARSAQMAADMQLAYELQAQQEQEGAIQQHLAQSTNEVAANSSILGGGTSFSAGAAAANPLASLGNMFSSNTRNRNHSLLDDGSSSMESNGSLLYVPCEVNHRMVEMMVDSGSQTSVLSSSMMRKLKLQKRLNTRFQGVAAGVGAARILGRIENCPVQIGAGVEFNLFFLVIDVPHDMMILGIDQMRRFKCMIDLEKNVLIFGGQGGVEVPFLPPDQNHANAREQCSIS
ncbi:DDI1 homolog 2 [Seminavis robusta]|uniref:DDI1 homolog 2 n=1 Tax=Seminavis robusta TaxID=568900 RepID=A0A9N8HW72_9STRA|nr:DDI1 homolog 2 [Seminavis robusta]|eukprot:Sro1608_g285710.1 DDI1 homolog 2 (238) ;mRNA; r:19361-20174